MNTFKEIECIVGEKYPPTSDRNGNLIFHLTLGGANKNVDSHLYHMVNKNDTVTVIENGYNEVVDIKKF